MIHLALIALLAQTPAASGSLQGVVVKAGSLDPLSKAIVELRADDGSAPLISSTTTESDGRFLFLNVRPGRYRIVTARSGYVRRPLSITVPQTQPQVVQVVLTQTATISGRVYGTTGEPLGNVDVQALKASYQDGRRTLTRVQSVRTNDRGEYRLFWLPAGRYYVSATHPDAPMGPMERMNGMKFAGSFVMAGVGGGARGTGDSIGQGGGPFVPSDAQKTERYVVAYFPGTIREADASAIELRAGSDVGGVDIPLAPVRAWHVRGVVINGATGEVAQYAGVRVDNLNVGRGSNITLGDIDRDGSFDLTLFPGPHTLVGTAGTGEGYVSVDVRDADIDGLRIVAVPEFNISGRIATDGPVEAADMENLRIRLHRDDGAGATPSNLYSNPGPDGSFVVEATPGNYRVSVVPLLGYAPGPSLTALKSLANAYVKFIRLGNVDVLNAGVHLEGPPTTPLEIVIGTNPGALGGSVLTAQQAAAAAGVTVVLLPDVRGRSDLYRTTTTDPSGRFHLDRVPPGDYKAFAWEDVSDGAWQDSEFMRGLEPRGTPLHVAEGSTAAVQLTVIPPE